MTDKLKEKTKELLETKPKEIQDVINSIDWGLITEEIGKQNLLLDESEINDLQVEVMLVLTGVETINNLESNIENNVNTDKKTAQKIKLELIEKLFKPITSKLTEKLKEKTKTEKPTWQQNINFILSGGDYSVFLQRTGVKNDLQDTQNPAPANMQININHSKLEDLKDNFTI
ncbi:MAG TPA: hypothetical protein PLO44_01635 [Candidatus Paceibacterota bacterium]|nr:hypothetical protein [Candidatus Paceibacterota bacterium]